jgi:hypothetical protein
MTFWPVARQEGGEGNHARANSAPSNGWAWRERPLQGRGGGGQKSSANRTLDRCSSHSEIFSFTGLSVVRTFGADHPVDVIEANTRVRNRGMKRRDPKTNGIRLWKNTIVGVPNPNNASLVPQIPIRHTPSLN